MDIEKPAFPLDLVKTLIREKKHQFTYRAIADFRQDFDMSEIEVLDFILEKLNPGHFVKTQESKTKPGLYQDVYRRKIYRRPRPIDAFIKFRIMGEHPDQFVLIISFHKSLERGDKHGER